MAEAFKIGGGKPHLLSAEARRARVGVQHLRGKEPFEHGAHRKALVAAFAEREAVGRVERTNTNATADALLKLRNMPVKEHRAIVVGFDRCGGVAGCKR